MHIYLHIATAATGTINPIQFHLFVVIVIQVLFFKFLPFKTWSNVTIHVHTYIYYVCLATIFVVRNHYMYILYKTMIQIQFLQIMIVVLNRYSLKTSAAKKSGQSDKLLAIHYVKDLI